MAKWQSTYKRWAGTRLKEQAVYIMYAPLANRYKIGISKNPQQRQWDINGSSPEEVSLLWWGSCTHPTGMAVELHEHFHRQCRHGEWFEGLTDEDIAFIKARVKGE